MSNIWSYDLVRPEPLSASEIEAALALLTDAGYAARSPAQVEPLVRGLTGSASQRSASDGQMTDVLAQDGGSVVLWKDEVDILLTVSAAASQTEVSSRAAGRPGRCQLAVSVDDAFFRREPARATLAADMKRVFIGLCELLGATYGYVSDEDEWEALVTAAPDADRARLQRPVLFFLNYFADASLSQLGDNPFAALPARVERLGRGVLVSFFGSPWEVDLPQLAAINQRWR